MAQDTENETDIVPAMWIWLNVHGRITLNALQWIAHQIIFVVVDFIHVIRKLIVVKESIKISGSKFFKKLLILDNWRKSHF